MPKFRGPTVVVKLDAHRLAFLIDAISLFDDSGDYSNGTQALSEAEINEFSQRLQFLLDGLRRLA